MRKNSNFAIFVSIFPDKSGERFDAFFSYKSWKKWMHLSHRQNGYSIKTTKKTKTNEITFCGYVLYELFLFFRSFSIWICVWNLVQYGIVQGDQWLYEPLKHVRHYADQYMYPTARCVRARTTRHTLGNYAISVFGHWHRRNRTLCQSWNRKIQVNLKTSFMDRAR